MSQTAARPWWAEVEHLRPAEHGGSDDRPQRAGRFDRATAPSRRPTGDAPSARAASRAGGESRAAGRAGGESRAAGRAGGESRAAGRAAEHAPSRPRHDPELWLEPAERPTTKPGERRTIEIRGQVDRVAGVAPVPSPGPQRHRGRRPSERVGPRPDRVALWAVLLGLLLILVAAISSPSADAAALLAPWL
jgi:hypothetical protein